MLRFEVRLVVILATLALLILLLIEWKVDSGEALDGTINQRGFRTSKALDFTNGRSAVVDNPLERWKHKPWYAFEPLPSNVIDSVDRFVFFVGYARSGHSIIGSMLDAHPNVVIAHEYSLFSRWSEHPTLFNNRTSLFNTLYNSSCYSVQVGLRSNLVGAKKKGYTLEIPGWYQGSYEGGISVIGDKAGGMTAQAYRNSKSVFRTMYQQLQATAMIPVHAIHVVRNPYDNIATMVLYNEHVQRTTLNETFKYNNVEALHRQVKAYFHQVQSVVEMIKNLGLNAITIHHSNFIANPKATMRRLCAELYLTCSERYLHMVAEHTFTTESHTRRLVKWTPELLNMVKDNIARYPVLKAYTFR